MLRRLATPHFARVATTAALASSLPTSGQRGLVFNPRTREYKFLLEDVHDMYTHYKKLPNPSENATPDFVNTIIDECGKVCTSTLFPLYQSGDAEGCVLHPDGRVTTPKGYKEAWNVLKEGGWTGVSYPEEFGGQGLPASIGVITKEMMATANWALLMYPGLTAGAATTLLTHGSPAHKETYLKPLVDGRWAGTMCLTEPHCGTDLAQVKTKAELAADGTYRLTGTKIFISSGDHDLTENIIHIVLARVPGSPEGLKGISLFLVPKYVVKADGSLDTSKRNVTCAGLEKKMGIKSSATGQMAFDQSVGYLLGNINDGMKLMFTFMNTARVGTAVQGVAHAELAFQNALVYARERLAMRALSGTKCPAQVADPIIHHASVKSMVLFAKAIAEGGRCMVMDMARIVDKYEAATSEADKKRFDAELGILTPIAKGFITELGLEAANHGMQVWGGHGYIVGNGMEQIARDARIATLYEGTTQVQSMDLIGRKLLLAKDNEFSKFQSKITSFAWQHAMTGGVIGRAARKLLFRSISWKVGIMKIKMGAAMNRDNVTAASVDFLMYSGYVTVGYYWLRMAVAAQKHIDKKDDADGFYKAKLDTCNFYFERILPRSTSHLELLSTDASSILAVQNDKMDVQ